jgi:outer membrane immunogenic protein
MVTATSAAIVAMSGFAHAADLPSRRAPPVYVPPAPIFSWTGTYIGLDAGYAFGRDSHHVPSEGAVFASSPKGVIGGGYVGYNYQISQFVIGLEGGVDGSSFSGSGLNPVTGTTVRTRIPIGGSIRGRVGIAFDRALFYASGGAAFADIDHSYFPAAGGLFDYKASRVGYAVGGGIEYAVTNNVSLRAEYIYSNFGKYSDLVAGFVPVYGHVTEQSARAGISYKFDLLPPPPVVAKY